MTPRFPAATVSLLVAALMPIGCSGTISGTDGDPALAETAAARAIVDELQARLQAAPRSAESALTARGLPRSPASGLPSSEAVGLYASNSLVRAHFAPARLAQIAHPADVALPRSASGAVALGDAGGALALTAHLRGALDARAEAGRGYVVYRNALPGGGHEVHRLTPTGTEDYLLLARSPGGAVIYDVELGAGVAGLRLVGSTLELLDARGAPRLRVAPPWLVGADGVRVAARLTVQGCAVDRDLRAPFGRAVTPPGASRCAVAVAWDEARVAYPAVLDPAWTTTGDLIIGREAHTATTLPSGQILIAGGASGDPVQLSEIFDPASGTFAAAAPTSADHVSATASTITQGGRTLVLVAGGQSYPPALAEAYDPTSGTWVAAGEMNTVRYGHTATTLASGQILVAGGVDLFGNLITGSERFDPQSATWTLAGYLNEPRQGHVAFVAPVGGAPTVVVAGGSSGSSVLGSAEAYDPLASRWTRLPAASLMVPRAGAGSLALPDGRVLVAGGAAGGGASLASVEIFDPASGLFGAGGSLSSGRSYPLLAPLANGAILAVGGTTADALLGAVSSAGADLYDPVAGGWTRTTALQTGRSGATATVLADGSVLVIGGRSYVEGRIEIVSSSERFHLEERGGICTIAVECQSGVCGAGACECAAGTSWCAESGSCLPSSSCCGSCDAGVSDGGGGGSGDGGVGGSGDGGVGGSSGGVVNGSSDGGVGGSSSSSSGGGVSGGGGSDGSVDGGGGASDLGATDLATTD